MTRYFSALIATMLSLAAVAQESQTAYNFLRMPESAHAAALGGDNISIIEDDATLALSNPALLSSVGGRTVTLGYMNYMDGVGMYTANYTDIVNEKATIGAAIHYINYDQAKPDDGTEVLELTEGQKQAMILEAEAQKESAIQKAKGEAEAIREVQQAKAEGLKMLKEAGMDEVSLRVIF